MKCRSSLKFLENVIPYLPSGTVEDDGAWDRTATSVFVDICLCIAIIHGFNNCFEILAHQNVLGMLVLVAVITVFAFRILFAVPGAYSFQQTKVPLRLLSVT